MVEIYPWQVDMWQRWVELRSRQPHALMLKGPQGTGKFEFAMKMAQSLLCQRTMFCGFACGECASCLWFGQGSHPDFRLVQPQILSRQDEEEKEGGKKPSKYIVIEQVRELADYLNLSSHQGGYRVIVVHPAETMNPNAANALLKSLEEPQEKVLFILVSHKPQQVMPTLRSRCLVLAAALPAADKSLAWLEGQGISDPAPLLSLAGYAPLQALRLANETEGMDEHRLFLQQMRQQERFDAVALAESLQKVEVARVVHWLQQWCYDLASAKFAGTVRYHPQAAAAILALAQKADPFQLLRLHKELLSARREASHPLAPRLLFESLFLSYRQALHT